MLNENKLLENKICFVSGASKGIGRGIITVFAKNGAIVYANCRKVGCLDEFAKEMEEKYNAKIIPMYFDILDYEAMKKAIIQIKKEQGRMDVLVNNAGIMKDALIGMASRQLMQETFDINVFAVMELTQLVSKLMIRQRSGSIINISSIIGVNGNKGQMVYSASKGAVISLTKSVAKELADKNIRVNAVAPGIIDTDLSRSIGEEQMNKRLNNVGMRRIGTSEDVANACLYLASDLSTYVTGQILGVDGSTLI